jgi:membrane protease YdiL (CAAX protease family)
VLISSSAATRPDNALRHLTPEREIALASSPVLVLATMLPVYRILVARFGPRLGYFLGFATYWLGWCFAFPLWLVGRRGVLWMFRRPEPRFGKPAWLGVASLSLPLVLAYSTVFPRVWAQANWRIVLNSLAISIVNAIGEEVLWRGAYTRAFRGRHWLGLAWPAIGFGVWHYAPLAVRPNRRPGGNHAFVVVALVLGFVWGRLAERSGSIRLTAVAHVLFDFAGLGALAYQTAAPPPIRN